MEKILVTGGCGFIGSNFIRHILDVEKNVEVINFDLLTYAGNLANLKDVEKNPRLSFVKGDIADKAAADSAIAKGVNAVIHFAAESHVDRDLFMFQPTKYMAHWVTPAFSPKKLHWHPIALIRPVRQHLIYW